MEAHGQGGDRRGDGSGELVNNLRRRIQHAGDQYPAQTIAAVAGAALICGALLRVWRSSRYELQE